MEKRTCKRPLFSFSLELDVLRLNLSRAKSRYVTKFLKFFLTFCANYDIIHNVKRGKKQKEIEKVKFPLDKFKNLWYNKDVIKRGNLLNIKNRVATVAKMKGVYYDYS